MRAPALALALALLAPPAACFRGRPARRASALAPRSSATDQGQDQEQPELYVADRAFFAAHAEPMRALEARALGLVNELRLGASLLPSNVRGLVPPTSLSEEIAPLSAAAPSPLALYACALLELAQQPLRLSSLLGHMALASLLLPEDTGAAELSRAHATAVRRLADDCDFASEAERRVAAGRLLLLLDLAPFPASEAPKRSGLALDALGVFMNVRLADDRRKAKHEAAREAWESLAGPLLAEGTAQNEAYDAAMAAADRLLRHALALLAPSLDAEKATQSLAAGARDQCEAMLQQAAPKDLAPLTRGLGRVRLRLSLMALLSGAPESAATFERLAEEHLRGAGSGAGLSSPRVFGAFCGLFARGAIAGERRVRAAEGADCLVLRQVLGLSPGAAREIATRELVREGGLGALRAAEAARPMAEGGEGGAPMGVDWSSLLRMMGAAEETAREACLAPLVRRRLEAGQGVLASDPELVAAGDFLGFESAALANALQAQLQDALRADCDDLLREVLDALQEDMAGAANGAVPLDDLPMATPEAAEDLANRARALGLDQPAARAVVAEAAREQVRQLCGDVLRFEEEKNVRAGAIALLKVVAVADAFAAVVADAIGGEEGVEDLLKLKRVPTDAQEVAVSEVAWAMRSDEDFKDAARRVQQLFGQA